MTHPEPEPAFDPAVRPEELARALIADDTKPWLIPADGDDPAPPDDRLAREPHEVSAEEPS